MSSTKKNLWTYGTCVHRGLDKERKQERKEEKKENK